MNPIKQKFLIKDLKTFQLFVAKALKLHRRTKDCK